MSDRTYRINGQDKPSITTIVHQLANPFLDQWKVKMAIDFIRENLDTVNYENVDDCLDIASRYHEQTLQTAAHWGTTAHQAIEDILKGEQNPYCLDGAMDKGVWEVARLLKKYDCKILGQEFVVWGDGYAGTVDLLCEIIEDIFLFKKDYTGKKVIALIDFKTSKGYYDSHKIQLAGYLSCKNCENNLEKYLTNIERCGIIRINKETGKVNCKDFFTEMPKWKKIFQGLSEIYSLMNVK